MILPAVEMMKARHQQLTGNLDRYEISVYLEDCDRARKARNEIMKFLIKYDGWDEDDKDEFNEDGELIKMSERTENFKHVAGWASQWKGSAMKRLKLFLFIRLIYRMQRVEEFRLSHRVYKVLFNRFTGRTGLSDKIVNEYLDIKDNPTKINDYVEYADELANTEIFKEHQEQYREVMKMVKEINRGLDEEMELEEE